jgi:pyruvate kinase
VYNQPQQFKKVMRHVGEPMPHEKSVASAAVNTIYSLEISPSVSSLKITANR